MINSVEFSVLPPIQNNLLTVRGKAGSYLYSQDYESREFKVLYTMITEDVNDVMSASREFADWLHHKEPVKLVFDDEPEKYYLVVPDGETTVDEIANLGQGEITFICIEPFAYGKRKEATFNLATEDDVAEVNVGGTVEAHPELNIKVKESITSLSIISENEESIIIGEPALISQSPKNPEPPLVVIEELEKKDLTNWVKAHHVDGGAITGDFASNDYSFRQKDNNYGTGDKWHGASRTQVLAKPLEDFAIHFGFTFKHTKKSQVGRVELYLLDENDNQFGKIAMVDKYASSSKHVLEARAGTMGEGTYFASGKNMNQWHDGYGRIQLVRDGREWTVRTSPKIDGKYDDYYVKSWFDSENKWTQKLAKIQIHIGTYGNKTPLNDMAISHITVRERLTLDDSEAPIIAIENDILTIDNEKLLVYLNGEPRFDLINPASDFIKFKKGINRLSLLPANAELNVAYNERWL